MIQLAATQQFALTYGESIAVLVGSMVVVVLVTAALETYTPPARGRSTRFTLPRRVQGGVEDLPTIQAVRGEYDRHLADALETKPSVLLRPGPRGPEPVMTVVTGGFDAVVAAGVEDQLDTGPPTEEVPIVGASAFATSETVEPAARATIRGLVAGRMVPPIPWDGVELRLRLPQYLEGSTQLFVEDALQAAMQRIEALDSADEQPTRIHLADTEEHAGLPALPAGVGVSDRVAGSTTVFVVRPEVSGAEVVELGDPGRDRELAGVLFAAYVATGGSERNRVTGWVTARDSAPSLGDIAPKDRLRGRPGKVSKLLACSDGGQNWVTLDERTDIRRGLTAKPPADPVLKGIVWWWFMATDDSARIPAEHVTVMREGLEAITGGLDGHAYAPTVEQILAACRVAEESRVGLRLESVGVNALSTDRRMPAGEVSPGREAVAVAS